METSILVARETQLKLLGGSAVHEVTTLDFRTLISTSNYELTLLFQNIDQKAKAHKEM